MASVKQVLNKFANRALKIVKNEGREWNDDGCWEANLEGLHGFYKFYTNFYAEYKAASDYEPTSILGISRALDDKIDEKRGVTT